VRGDLPDPQTVANLPIQVTSNVPVATSGGSGAAKRDDNSRHRVECVQLGIDQRGHGRGSKHRNAGIGNFEGAYDECDRSAIESRRVCRPHVRSERGCVGGSHTVAKPDHHDVGEWNDWRESERSGCDVRARRLRVYDGDRDIDVRYDFDESKRNGLRSARYSDRANDADSTSATSTGTALSTVEPSVTSSASAGGSGTTATISSASSAIGPFQVPTSASVM